MRRFWSVLGLTTALATLQLIGFPNQKVNEAQAHCRAWHPHHCTIQEVVDDVGKTVDRWGLAAAHPSLIPVSGYLEFLFQQGNGRWKPLPDDFKAFYRRHYSFNLDDVRYATNINTVHGQAITVDSQIYFPTDVNLSISNSDDRLWMLHELEHVRQYQVVGGVTAFLIKYSVQGGMEVGKSGSFKIHDNIGLESEAESKANRVLYDFSIKIRNKNWGRCLNLQSATKNGVATNAWECVSHPDQEWKIEDAGNGFVKLRNKNWGKCLNLQSATKNGVATNAWECVSHPDQEWKIEDAGNGFVKLRNRNWGRCLNLQSADRNGVTTNAWECVSHPDQEWKIENAG